MLEGIIEVNEVAMKDGFKCVDFQRIITNNLCMGNRNNIPNKLKQIMAARSGGRCQLCSKYLYSDIFGNETNLSELAHNIPFSHNGPRATDEKGQKITAKYKQLNSNNGYNADNLLVLCPSCHKSIDDNPHLYTIDYLIKLKSLKEKAILEAGTKLISQKTVIKFTSPIANKIVSIDNATITNVLFKEYTIVENPILDLSNEVLIQNETYEEYMSNISKQTERLFKQKVENSMETNSKNFVFFALAPQPLLIKLGTLLNNYHNVEIREFSRTSGWSWKGESELNFKITPPKTINKNCKNISLFIEVSSCLCDNEIDNSCSDIWRLEVIGEKAPDIIGSPKELFRFERCVYQFFSTIKENYGSSASINLYPAMPISLAIKFGAIYMPNAFNKIVLFDKVKNQNNEPKFVKALEIF